ncbi:hypothetical protein F5Y12DRAFT_794290 [Xylaria sp. FL1777]|nr:hypothetical protein F5Y12DRAFT_794290 [Xylaria sp. FL1777]
MSSSKDSENGQRNDGFENIPESDQQSVISFTIGETPTMENEIETLTTIGTWSELAKNITAYTPAALAEVGSNARVKVDLICEICQDKHLRLPPWLSGMVVYTDENSEAICVLPCGHFFGSLCLKTWVFQQILGEAVPMCPMCRHPLVHKECRHAITLVEVPPLDPTDPKSITHHVPYTRVHKLLPGPETVFVDVSTWDPAVADKEHNFGIDDCCSICEEDNELLSELEDSDEMELDEMEE